MVRIVASDANDAGFESELQVSVPKPSVARLVATAVAVPPLDPEVLSVGSKALPIVPPTRADAEVAERELVEVRLAEQHRAGAAHARGDARVEPRPVIDQRPRSAGRRQTEDVDVVLEDHRDAVHRAARAGRRRARRRARRASATADGFNASIESKLRSMAIEHATAAPDTPGRRPPMSSVRA